MKKKKTFGIIEVLIACTILILICASIQFLNIVITNSILFAKQRTTAYYLAQEGIEAVRSIRDTNLVDDSALNTNWQSMVSGVTTPESPSGYNKFDVDKNYSLAYPTGTDNSRYSLQENSGGEKIKADGTIDYTRKITFSDSNLAGTDSNLDPDLISGLTSEQIGANSTKVTAKVSWNFRGKEQTVEVSEILTNWKQQL